MVKPVLEQDPGDGHPELGGIGEIRQTPLSGRMPPPRLSPRRTDSEHPRGQKPSTDFTNGVEDSD